MKQKDELIRNPKDIGRHIVILGAGASRAAIGHRSPTMNELVETTGIKTLLESNAFSFFENFEELYSNLSSDEKNQKLLLEIEEIIHDYFSGLNLPAEATHYDRMLLSLRKKDSIFSFNWDPFLFDAYKRNRHLGNLPGIFFLHGNVRIGACPNHSYRFGDLYGICPDCSTPYSKVPLLYPIGKKNYQNNSYIAAQWARAKKELAEAFTLTIFGYSAPTSDVDAKELLKLAWKNSSTREFEHIEIIDIEEKDVLCSRWADFSPTFHFLYCRDFHESRLWNWPRRTCESLWYPMAEGVPCESFPLPNNKPLDQLQDFISYISKFET
ncbi:hypothetical protein [Legionella cardiaca]|uniref:Deacetylase sirtuin-type domain-containing protein n=1 Tax=Legionella cardiaca TaxID=1071983 RepID=A0ABY8ANG1_9GAMM|nr:hypothetical protein [Legionella cardiaca]WED42228.1 hypothetical protein PXX05_09835 [Legionella cardiaca]